MRTKFLAVLTLTVLFAGYGVNGTCGEINEYGQRTIKHRANVGGDCKNPDSCVGIVGNKLYNYQESKSHGGPSLKEMDDVEKGNLSIDREGLQIDKATREKFDLNEGDVKNARSVHQYIEIKRDINGNVDGKVVDLGSMENKDNRNMQTIENIVKVDGDIKGFKEGNVGQVNLENSKMSQISTTATIDGKVDQNNGQSLSVGGVEIETGTVSDGIKSRVLIKGD